MKTHNDRLLDRYDEAGIKGLLPRSALELLFECMHGVRDPQDLADKLFQRYGSLTDILNASPSDLKSIPDMPMDVVDVLRFMPMYFSAVSSVLAAQSGLDDTGTACGYFREQLRWTPVEQFKLVCMTDGFTALCCITLGDGSGTQVSISADDIIREAQRRSSQFVMIAHNHPSGSCVPSDSDISSTVQLRDELIKCGISLVDHIIIGRDGAYSMLRSGGSDGL